MDMLHYLNGRIVPENELLISPRDLGYTRGFAVFEFFRTYRGRPFMLTRHLERLRRSAALIHLPFPWSNEALAEMVSETLRHNKAGREYAMRLVISGGKSRSLALEDLQSVVIMVDETIEFGPEMYEDGIKVKTLQHCRYMPEAKTTHYISAVTNLRLARESGCSEIIYFDSQDRILEGACSNVFIVADGAIVTPKDCLLEGVTRGILLDLLDSEVKQTDVTSDQLASASEVFISVSGKGIVPVVEVDGCPVGDGSVGITTKRCMELFNEFVRGDNW